MGFIMFLVIAFVYGTGMAYTFGNYEKDSTRYEGPTVLLGTLLWPATWTIRLFVFLIGRHIWAFYLKVYYLGLGE